VRGKNRKRGRLSKRDREDAANVKDNGKVTLIGSLAHSGKMRDTTGKKTSQDGKRRNGVSAIMQRKEGKTQRKK